MAPPTLYNNALAKYTKYEQSLPSKILDAEVCLAKAMLTQSIDLFNTTAPTAPAGNMDTIFSTTIASTSTTEQLTNLMINHNQSDLGSVFALAAVHKVDNAKGVPGSDTPSHLSFPTTSGSIGVNLATNASGIVYLSNDSASYYDSQVVCETDNTENVFTDRLDTKYNVTFDTTNTGYNAEKGVNSRYSNYVQGGLATANPDSNQTDPLTIGDSTIFNSLDSLYTEKIVTRDGTTSKLDVSSTLTNAISTLVNSFNGSYYSGSDGFCGIKSTDHTNINNNKVFFGAIRVTQIENNITISGNAGGSTSTTLSMIPSGQGSPLTTDMTPTQFNNLFTPSELANITSTYSLNITSTTSTGGYSTSGAVGTVGTGPFRGFTTDDTIVKRNTTYMRKCAEEGQDFSHSVQTVEIVNGDHIASRTFTGPNVGFLINRVDAAATDINSNPAPHDTDEKLSSSQYQTDCYVRTHFTEPSTSVSATYPRAEGAIGNTSKYTDFKVAYDITEDASILPNDRRSRYYENFDITTVFPNTSVQGNVFSGSNLVGIDNGFAAVFQTETNAAGAKIVKSGINSNSDYTFTSSAAAAAKIADNEIAIIQIVNTQYMAQEDSLYAAGATGPVLYTNATVIGTNINYTTLANATSGTTDLRVSLSAKTGLTNSTFTNDWSSSLSTGSVLQTDLDVPGIFGDSTSTIMTDVTTVAGHLGSIPISFECLTSGTAENRDSLDLSISYNWSYRLKSGSGIILESDITLTGTVPAPTTTTLILGSHYSTTTNLNPVVANLLTNYDLVRSVETYTTTPSFLLAIGAYNNVRITGKSIVIRTVYHTLVNKTTAVKLSDSYLKNIEFTGTYVNDLIAFGYGQSKASRQIIGLGKTSIMTLSIRDLYAFTSVIQRKDSSSNWTNASPSYDFDGAYNSFTTFALNDDAGTITGSIDITTDSQQNVILDQPLYYIELTTGPDTTSYSVVAKTWNINTVADAQSITYWASSNDVTSTTMPSNGTSITLTANVTSSPVASNPSTQSDVTITVTDYDGTVWAKFVTHGVIASSSFNVLFARRPVFSIVETYKNVTITVGASGAVCSQDVSDTVGTTYKMAGSSTKLQVIDGIALTFLNDTGITDSGSFRLLGDYVDAALYNGYTGPYSTLSEVTFANGLELKDSVSRGIGIRHYRGNSVRTASAPATFEEFRWTRRPTKIYMKIVNTNSNSVSLTYTDTQTDLYDGSTHTVVDLTGGIGDLGLKFTGKLSRFRKVNTTYTTQDVAMSQPITILFDAYQVSVLRGDIQDVSEAVLTSKYSIQNYTGSNAMNIVASRVWIRESVESYVLSKLAYSGLIVDYLPEQYVGNPSAFDWTTSSKIDTLAHTDLLVGIYIKTPSTIAGGVKDSIIFIKRANINVTPHVGYFLLPRPQHVIEAIATNAVTSLPYNFTTAVRTVRYFDLNLEVNSHKPFAGGFGTINGLPAGVRVVNDMTVVFNKSELYVDRRFTSASNTKKIYIPSNKVIVKLYKGYSAHLSSGLDSGSLITTIYNGYIHKLKNYDVDAYPVTSTYTDPCGNAIDSSIYNKFGNTYIGGRYNARSDMTYDLYFSQDYSIISPGITDSDMYGENGVKVINIEIEGLTPFMNLTSVTVANRHLDLLPGDSVSLKLYGHTINTDIAGNLVVEYVRYTTGIGYDFTSNAAEVFIKNIGFNASIRETCSVILKAPSSILTATPFNLINVCKTLASSTSFNSLTWVADAVWAAKSTQEKQVAFNIVCLSTVGQSQLIGILGVSSRSPFRMLVCNYPNRIDLRSGDGSPLYVVNAFGRLTNSITSTKILELTPSQPNNSTNDVEEYGAYNSLIGNTF